MRFTPDFIQEVLDRTDISAVVGRYVPLKRAGSNMVACCPFHSEKTPSFSVSPSKRMFYCFGCHAGGSAITFIQKIENVDFPDAVEMLANEAGLAIPIQASSQKSNSEVGRKRVLEMNKEVAKFYHACLMDEKIGKEALAYYKKNREFTDATIAHFGLGFAPNSWDMTTKYLREKGFTDREMIEGGLAKKSEKNNGVYDFFRNRVMIPVIDTSGNVVAFSGRVLDASLPKYLNTSDTPAFSKSNTLFALNFAKNYASEKMVLCEGAMDVIAVHQAGFPFAVATLGTAITPNHARMFSKYTKKVIISYDSDEAGQNAAKKAMQLLGEVGLDVRVLQIKGAKDPDEYIKKFGSPAFAKLLEESHTGFAYKTEKILEKYNLNEGSEKIRAVNELCAEIASYSSDVEREVYIAEVVKKVDMPAEVLRESIKKLRSKKNNESKKKVSEEAKANLFNYGDRVNPEASKNPRATAVEEAIIGLLIIYEEYRNKVEDGRILLTANDFCTAFSKKVFEAIMNLHKEGNFVVETLGETFSPDEMGRIKKCEVERSLLSDNGENVFVSLIDTLKEEKSKTQSEEMSLTDLIKLRKEKNK